MKQTKLWQIKAGDEGKLSIEEMSSKSAAKAWVSGLHS